MDNLRHRLTNPLPTGDGSLKNLSAAVGEAVRSRCRLGVQLFAADKRITGDATSLPALQMRLSSDSEVGTQ